MRLGCHHQSSAHTTHLHLLIMLCPAIVLQWHSSCMLRHHRGDGGDCPGSQRPHPYPHCHPYRPCPRPCSCSHCPRPPRRCRHVDAGQGASVVVLLLLSLSCSNNPQGSTCAQCQRLKRRDSGHKHFNYTNKANKGKQCNIKATNHLINLERKQLK